jgi:restriction endonuclease Mrr
MLEVTQMDRFPSLVRQQNGEQLLAQAREAVANLLRWTKQHQGLLDEKERFAAELTQSQARMQVQQGFTAKLAELKKQFGELAAMSNRQKAGRLFEPFLNELFHLFDLEPRLSYELASEQIDGSMTFDTDDYIIEAKWWKEPMQREHFDTFDAKVKRKGKNALGLFMAVNGFTAGARREYNQRTSFLTMDGGDLICVLDGRITLDELLRRKKRYANETGNCYFPAQLAVIE